MKKYIVVFNFLILTCLFSLPAIANASIADPSHLNVLGYDDYENNKPTIKLGQSITFTPEYLPDQHDCSLEDCTKGKATYGTSTFENTAKKIATPYNKNFSFVGSVVGDNYIDISCDKEICNDYFGKEVLKINVLPDKIDNKLALKLKGSFIKDQNGGMWYLNPTDLKRYYIGTPEEAFLLIRKLGVAISNNEILKIPTNKNQTFNQKIINKYKGKLLIQTKMNGEAWYVNPSDNIRYFLGKPEKIYTVLKTLAIDISNDDLNKIAINDDYRQLKYKKYSDHGVSFLYERNDYSSYNNADQDFDSPLPAYYDKLKNQGQASKRYGLKGPSSEIDILKNNNKSVENYIKTELGLCEKVEIEKVINFQGYFTKGKKIIFKKFNQGCDNDSIYVFSKGKTVFYLSGSENGDKNFIANTFRFTE